MAAEIRASGFEVTEHVGKTGLVAIYKNGDGPTIMVRTELDALPMREKTGLAYASHDKSIWQGRETFVAHCGHDIHMASWVGTAKTLVGLKDQRHRTLMFIAQPAEEIASGAKAILADGLFTGFPKPDSGFALHANGAFAYGTVLYHVGIGSSNADGLYIKFRGRGGHGAVPQATIDPMMMAACFVVDVQHRTNETSKRPETIPGIGIIGASAIAATVAILPPGSGDRIRPAARRSSGRFPSRATAICRTQYCDAPRSIRKNMLGSRGRWRDGASKWGLLHSPTKWLASLGR